MHNVPAGSETHFKVLVVSSRFSDVSLVKRHRMVNEALKSELDSGLHALSIVAKTEEQWRKMVGEGKAEVESSPKCRGGFGK
jgi:stress-induced morphogen